MDAFGGGEPGRGAAARDTKGRASRAIKFETPTRAKSESAPKTFLSARASLVLQLVSALVVVLCTRVFLTSKESPNSQLIKMFKLVAFGLLIASALAVPTSENPSLDCSQYQDDYFSCIAVKMASSLNRASRSSEVNVVEGVTFIRQTPLERSGKSLKSETEIMNELPQDSADRTLQLASMIYESAVSFFKSYSLKIDMPEGSVSRALSEGRAKIKKLALPLIAAAGLKVFALVPILLGGLALLVAKAVVVGKVALLIAGILAFQRLFSGGSVGQLPSFNGFGGNFFNKNPVGYYNDNQGWSSSVAAGQSQGYYRSFSDKNDAHKLAYSAQAPNSNEAN